LVSTAASLYTNLSATITTPSWAKAEIPLQVGVYQGDPLTTAIFNTVMCTLIEALRPFQHLVYTFSQKQQVSQACHLLAPTDPAVRFATTVDIKREEALQ